MSIRSKLSSIFTLTRGTLGGLSEATAGADPIVLFREWFEAAKRAGIYLPESMTLATATRDARPSARMVLLKGVSGKGLEFYTNYESRKARELDDNPFAALVFHWSSIQRQVRVEGAVQRLSAEESEAYFRTRPRGSRLGAWASHQSAVVSGRDDLDRRFKEVSAEYSGREVPLPPYWGGYRLKPDQIEFWQGRINRLHDRLRYTRTDGGWRLERLSP